MASARRAELPMPTTTSAAAYANRARVELRSGESNDFAPPTLVYGVRSLQQRIVSGTAPDEYEPQGVSTSEQIGGIDRPHKRV